MRHGGKPKPNWAVVQWSVKYIREFQEVNVVAMPKLPLRNSVWAPPVSPLYKVNVDGAIFSSQHTARIGVVIWDCRGLIVDALSKKPHQPLDPLEVEAKDFEVGLLFARDIGLHEIILEGDSIVVANSIAGKPPSPSIIACVFYGISYVSCIS